MRSIAIVAVYGCGFSASLPAEIAPEDAAPIDAIDAMVDAKALPACPPAPAGCTPFDCATTPASCYYYCPEDESSGGANGICDGIAANSCLVTLDSELESTCVRMAAGAGDLIYVGLRQTGNDEPAGGWGWYCGTSMYGPNWNPGEPSNSGTFGEDCAAINTLGKWIDVGCGETFRFICEAPRPPG